MDRTGGGGGRRTSKLPSSSSWYSSSSLKDSSSCSYRTGTGVGGCQARASPRLAADALSHSGVCGRAVPERRRPGTRRRRGRRTALPAARHLPPFQRSALAVASSSRGGAYLAGSVWQPATKHEQRQQGEQTPPSASGRLATTQCRRQPSGRLLHRVTTTGQLAPAVQGTVPQATGWIRPVANQ